MNTTDVKVKKSQTENIENDFSINYDLNNSDTSNKQVSLHKEDDDSLNKGYEINYSEAFEKFGEKLETSDNKYKNAKEVIVELNDQDLAQVKQQVSNIKKSLFESGKNEIDIDNELMLMNMNIASQVGDKYNQLNYDLSKTTQLNNTDEITVQINELNSIIKGHNADGSLKGEGVINKMLSVFTKAKRNHQISKETIDDKVNTISDALKAKREQQKGFLDYHKKREIALYSFINEINKTIYVSREMLVEVAKKRVEYANKVREQQDSSLVYLSFYKKFKAQEESLESLISNLLSVRLALSTSFNKNDDNRVMNKSIFDTLNQILTFLVPRFRDQLVEYATSNKVTETLDLMKITKKMTEELEKRSMSQFKENRLEAAKLSSQSLMNINDLAKNVEKLIEVDQLVNEAKAQAREVRNEEIKIMEEAMGKLKNYAVGKEGFK